MTADRPVILLVEDNAADASMLIELLEEHDPPVQVVHVGTGERALAHLHGQIPSGEPLRPRLIVMDLRLPGRSGREILGAIRSSAELQRIPVVILSTSGAAQDVDGCYAAGANVYLRKHSDPDKLEQQLHAAVKLLCFMACAPTRPE